MCAEYSILEGKLFILAFIFLSSKCLKCLLNSLIIHLFQKQLLFLSAFVWLLVVTTYVPMILYKVED